MIKSKWDGKSRVSNDTYRKRWQEIFNTNPVAKEVRTPKFKSQIIKSKKIYDRKKLPKEDQKYLNSLKDKL